MIEPEHRRRALLSVSDKTDLVPFAQALVTLSFELVSTGGTAKLLREAGLPVTSVSSVTGFPEIMEGRVKTLHPAVHGGLLARRGVDDAVAAEHGITLIDLLVVNLYPFEDVIAKPDTSDAEAIENIDIGGPAMLRAAAKNHERVTVVVDAADYTKVLDAYGSGEPSQDLKRRLASKVFAHTAAYDARINGYLRAHEESSPSFPERLVLGFKQTATLRYGENPHQQAALYVGAENSGASVVRSTQHQGKVLSFNNLVDADAALQCVIAMPEPACVVVKHANPCGVAIGANPEDAYIKAYSCDPTSAFGGGIAFNQPLNASTAKRILNNQFAEVIIAPEVEADALDVFGTKPNIRVLSCGSVDAVPSEWEIKSLAGGILVQDKDHGAPPQLGFKVVSERAPSDEELRDLKFAWQVVRFVKSNAIVFAHDGQTVGIGAGQMSRVMSTRIAAIQAEEHGLSIKQAVMASDAFFPFRDGIDAAAKFGIRAVIQPGGSMRDDDIIAAANEHGMAMVFTHVRHFRH